MIFIRTIIFIIPLFTLVSCSVVEQIPGKPWHHTIEGFRNPPGSPEKNNWIRRVPWLIGKPFKALFGGPPKIPNDHVLEKAKVIEGLKNTS